MGYDPVALPEPILCCWPAESAGCASDACQVNFFDCAADCFYFTT
ncbi:hypothetical protein [Nevskia sp.]|nr:hypothetical protein [Nevskia sp.]